MNRLGDESSPYLLAHKENPVDWYPWGQEAFASAAALDKPIYLSVGYSACHWCHVMERESFEDAATAQIMNDGFVNIKVDREERPDVDAIYMDAVQAMTGRGGWPMSVFLAPSGEPFFAGTYFPPVQHHNMPSFGQVLEAVREAWDNKRDQVISQGQTLVSQISQSGQMVQQPVRDDTLAAATRTIKANWDETNGGLGAAPKFPQFMVLDFLLSSWSRTGDPSTLSLVEHSLTRMARGGLYDQLGGGFHRYCVDATWSVPHFEKMLYDNALAVPVYLHAYQVTGNPLYQTVATETLDYLTREMLQPEGGLSSSQDADSEGEEGKFFAWTKLEFEQVLAAAGLANDKIAQACLYFGVTPEGNFEQGATVLHVSEPDALSQTEVERARSALLSARAQRVPPATDDKVLASWNGLALSAFAMGARILNRPDYLATARGIADHIMGRMVIGGRLRHSWRNGQSTDIGFSEDYAAVAVGLLDLYRSTFDPTYFGTAQELVTTMIQLFADSQGGFFTTSADANDLIVRPKEIMDNAVPSGNSLAAQACALLFLYTNDYQLQDHAVNAISVAGNSLVTHAVAFGQALSTWSLLTEAPVEVAIVGATDGNLIDFLNKEYLPHVVVAAASEPADNQPPQIPLLEGRTPVGDQAAAYVCRQFVCQLPVTDVDKLAGLMSAIRA